MSSVSNSAFQKVVKKMLLKDRYISVHKDVKQAINAKTADEFKEKMIELNTKKPIMPIGVALIYANCMFFLPCVINDETKLSKEKVTLRTVKTKAADSLTDYANLLSNRNSDTCDSNLAEKVKAIVKKIKRVPSPIWKALINAICDSSYDEYDKLNNKFFVTE